MFLFSFSDRWVLSSLMLLCPSLLSSLSPTLSPSPSPSTYDIHVVETSVESWVVRMLGEGERQVSDSSIVRHDEGS